jgi:hypothetical protein
MENELEGARFQGRHVTEIAARLVMEILAEAAKQP